MLALEASQLRKVYRRRGGWVEAVRSVSLQLARGEVLAFLGPNGAGKTTTIKMLLGLIRPDGGCVRILGRDPLRDTGALAEVGAVLEGNRNIYWRLTPLENLEYFGVLKGLSQRQARRRATDLLQEFGLSDKRDTTTQKLSRGMQQKVALAVALIHQPAVLLLDEPTLGLDVEATQSVKALIRQIAAQGRGILLTTHQLDIAEALSDRVAIVQKGQVVVESSPRELIRRFSGSRYSIESEQAPDAVRIERLRGLGASVEGTRIRFAGSPEALHEVLEALRPLALLRLEREDADLTQVFLKVVQDHA